MPAQIASKGIVLRKTKLGEADLIITLLDSDGSCMQAVARGARKPKNTFASRLELFSLVEVFCASTKGLPLVQEARLIDAHQSLRLDFDRATAASVVVELIAKSTHEHVSTPRLFDLVDASLAAMARCLPEKAYAIALATCLKTFAYVGVRPCFRECAACGKKIMKPVKDAGNDGRRIVAYSIPEGGGLCDECAASLEVMREQAVLFEWLDELLYSTFVQIETFNVSPEVLSFGFHFVQSWAHEHIGVHLKSIPFLLSNAMFVAAKC